MEDYVVIMAGEEEAELSSESGEGVSLDCSPCSEDRELTTSQNESSRLQEVTLYLSHLVGSYDTGTLTEACMGLAESIREADEGCLQLLCERDVVGVIVRLMEELPTHHDLQLILCDNLLQCSEQVGLRSGMDDHSVYRVVLAVLKRHRDRPELLGKALHVLASIAGTTFREDALREAMAYTSVLAVLRDYPEHTVVQSGGMMALTHLLKSDSYAAATVVLRDDHKLILNSLERHRDSATVVTSALNVLEVLCSNSNQGMVSLLNSSALRLAVEAIHMYGGDVEVVSSGCGVVDVLTEAAIKHPSAQFQSGMEQHQVTDLLVTKLQQYSGIIKIQTSALSALANLLLLLPLLSPPSINTYTWLCLIHSAFEAFSTDIRVQEVCCRCLARLMEKNPDLHHFIGRDSPKIQLPLHDSVWLVLLDQTKTADPRVFQSVVLALYYLVVDSEVLHRVLLEKGAAVAVLEGVREFLHDYSRDEVCVEYGCRALVALIMQNCSDAEKAYLYSLNILADIMTILEKFRFDPGVISEVFGVIACLANLSDFVEALGNNGVHRQILRSVREYSHHPVLVESGLEVMIILSQTNAMNQLLNEGDALECTAALMRHHINSPPIQRKGCLVIRLLCSTEYLTSQSVCTSLASAVVGALAQWRTEPAVEVEALVCIHKLSVSSEQMAGALVKRELHLLLFSMLYDWQEEGGRRGRE